MTTFPWDSMAVSSTCKYIKEGENSSKYWNFFFSHTRWLNHCFQKWSNSCDSCDTLETYSSLHLYQRKQITLTIARDTLQMLFVMLQPDSHIWWRPSVWSDLILHWVIQQMENNPKAKPQRETSFLYNVTTNMSSLFQFIGRMIVLFCVLHTREHFCLFV